jgi:hypothetical protein
VSAAPKAARPVAKAASPAPKPPVEAVKQASVAKPAFKPMAKKMAGASREPTPSAKAKTVAANGKLVVKKSKKEVR